MDVPLKSSLIVFLLIPIFLNNIFAQNDANVNKNIVQSDEMFPSGPSAKAFIDFDGKGLIIHGKHSLLISGSVHYPRVPQQNWHDILLKLKRAGFNAVETYVFWNFHEPTEGKYDFTSERHDIGAFLNEAQQVGLYAIVRVGPYVCAEWENGGFPTWLMQKPGMILRKSDSQEYLDEVSKWFNKLLPIIAKHQIQNGGNVILVQLENEHPAEHWKYWGTNVYGKYFQLLLDLAHQNGLQIPMFFSGMHHAFDPVKAPIYPQERKSPWMCMELWTTWFDNYGTTPEVVKNGERHPWRVISMGGAGFNLYMGHGGSTFGYYNFNGDSKYGDKAEKGGTSYDYATLIGQAGDTRELYLRLKRLGYFAGTFAPLLGNSINSSEKYKDWLKGMEVTARSADSGTIVFLDNPRVDTLINLPSGVAMHMDAGEIVGLVNDFPIADGLSIQKSESRILGIAKDGNITTIVCFGHAGDIGKISFSQSAGKVNVVNKKDGFALDGSSLSMLFQIDKINEQLLHFGKKVIRVLAMDKEAADKTWFIKQGDNTKTITGASYLGEFNMGKDGGITVSVDEPWEKTVPSAVTLYGAQKTILMPGKVSPRTGDISLGKWTKYADQLADNSAWTTLKDTVLSEIGSDGCLSPYAWYYSQITNNTTIDSVCFGYIGDRATFYIDGKMAAQYDFRKDKSSQIPVKITAGKHQMSVFLAYSGRNKLAGYAGPTNLPKYKKGLIGPVVFNGHDTVHLKWSMKGRDLPASFNEPAGTDGQIQPAFYQSSFNLAKLPQNGEVYRLQTTGLSAGSVWMNGINIGKYPELVKGCPGLWLPSVWMRKGDNELIIYDEQGNSLSSGSVKIVLEKGACRKQVRYMNK